MLIIDPPSGWQYGFPKRFDILSDDGEPFRIWLLNNGYPEHMVELAMKYSRYWEERL